MTTVAFHSYNNRYSIIFPIEIDGDNIGIIYFGSNGRVRLKSGFLPPSEVRDKLDSKEEIRMYNLIISKLRWDQKHDLIEMIFKGKLNV